jgi:hypothetical protein
MQIARCEQSTAQRVQRALSLALSDQGIAFTMPVCSPPESLLGKHNSPCSDRSMLRPGNQI